MANHKSAAKRARQSERRRIRNRVVRGQMRGAIKEVQAQLQGGGQETQAPVAEAIKQIYKTATKGVIHRRQAARRVSRLMRAQNKAAAK